MISYEEALSAILARVRPLPAQEVALTSAQGLVLAQPVIAECDWPLFDNSAVDGFGVRLADVAGASPWTPVRLRLVGTVQAGSEVDTLEPLSQGCTWRILTGAAVPASVDAMVMKEQVTTSDEIVVVEHCPTAGEHVRRRGEEFNAGTTLLHPGVRVTPPVIGLLAALGRTACIVHRRPVVALVCTGDELVTPGRPLKPGQVYDSNASALGAALRTMGAETRTVSQVADDPDTLEAVLGDQLQTCDVLITVGGVSVGEFDFVKAVMARLGVQQVFWQVAIKPGKPNFFGTWPSRQTDVDPTGSLVFGLPGNPVSALCSLHQLVRPAIRRLSGLSQPIGERFEAILDQPLRQRPGRLDFMRGRLRLENGAWHVTPVRGQGSHMIGGLALADCLIHVPADVEHIAAGETVVVEKLEW